MEKFPKLGEEKETLDSRWFERFLKLQFSDFDKLDGDKVCRQVEKEKFESNQVRNPDLDYPILDVFPFKEKEEKLLVLKAEILEEEQNEIVKKIYRTKINESLALLRMLQAAATRDDRRFSRYAEFVYGKPDLENTAIVLDSFRKKIEKALGSNDEAKQQAAQEMSAVISSKISEVVSMSRPFVKGENIVGNIETSEELKSAFEGALDNITADEWKVVSDTEKGVTNYRISQENKEVVLPNEDIVLKGPVSKRRVRAFIEHEINTHVARRENGERSKLQLLGIGLDRYEKGEEGVATYMEQQVLGADDFAHPQRYFAIAYAKGMIDGRPHDFRDTYDVLRQYYLMALKSGEEKEQKASDFAWRLAVRIFRGTSSATPGAVYTKDMLYFVGNKETWTLVSKDSDVVQYFTIGKFDVYNSEHLALLFQLGILDEDLTNLLED